MNFKLPDLWHNVTCFLDHYRNWILCLIFALMLGGYLVGCEVKTNSLIDPTRTVSSRQLQNEANKIESEYRQREKQLQIELEELTLKQQDFNAQLTIAVEDLETQTKQRQQIIDTLGGLAVQAAQGNANPISALTTIISLISAGSAVGLGLDSLRKDRVISKLKTDPNTSTS
ncbi:MAG: hypothetical protein CMJ19_20415 [Phycisphaeraceae bacterium]|nr:hypothetical protein [Phycisphaeraceae bacterium]